MVPFWDIVAIYNKFILFPLLKKAYGILRNKYLKKLTNGKLECTYECMYGLLSGLPYFKQMNGTSGGKWQLDNGYEFAFEDDGKIDAKLLKCEMSF